MDDGRAGRFVVDTNTLISRLLIRESIPSLAVTKAIRLGDLLFSSASLAELNDVISRPKFDRYLEPGDREAFFRMLSRIAVRIEISHPVRVCRDPKDDKFLEVALNGRADAIISGDSDLLTLNPFRGIPILSPRQFLNAFEGAV